MSSEPDHELLSTGRFGTARRFALIALLIWQALAFSHPSLASEAAWNVNFSSVWSSPLNWLGPVPATPGDVANFGNVITLDRLISLDVPVSAGHLRFDDDNRYRIGGFQMLTLSEPGGNASITIGNSNGNGAHVISAPVSLSSPVDLSQASAGVFTISGAISGTGALTKSGSGTLVLSGDNSSWGGSLAVRAGVARLGFASPVMDSGAYKGLGTGAVTVMAGATLDLDLAARTGKFSGSIVNTISVAGEGADGVGALRTSRPEGTVLKGDLVLTAPATFAVGSEAQGGSFGLNLGDPATGTGALRGPGSLTLRADAQLLRPAPVQLNVRAEHAGGTVLQNMLLEVSPLGSLVGTGPITVGTGSQLRVSKGAGTLATSSSASPNSVVLTGGTLATSADIDITAFLSPLSTSGALTLHGVQFSGGGSNLLDLSAIGPMGRIRVGADLPSTIKAGVQLKPESGTRTFRFGGAPSDLTVEAIVADSDASPTHVEQDGGGRLILKAANTYSGKTFVRDGILEVVHAQALGASGSEGNGTEVANGGQLSIAPGLTMAAEQIRLSGGRLTAHPNSVLQSPITIDVPSQIWGGDLRGVISGAADITLSGGPGAGLILRAANTFTGPVTVNGGPVEVRHPQALGPAAAGTTIEGTGDVRIFADSAEPMTVRAGGRLHLGIGAIHAQPITLIGGTMTADPGAIYNGTLQIQSGAMQVDLKGNGTIAKTTPGTFTVQGLGAAFDGPIQVQQGTLSFFGDVLGSNKGSTTVAAPTGAILLVRGGASGEPINLNNATGNGVGGLICEADFPVVLSGAVDLGAVGSTVGFNKYNNRLTLAGPVSGGSLTVKSFEYNNHLRLTNPANSYSGATRIKDSAILVLAEGGRLTGTSAVFSDGGILWLDNSKGHVGDRIADHVPIHMSRRMLRLDEGAETVSVVVENSGTRIDVHTSTGTTLGYLTLASLTRAKGTLVEFSSSNYYRNYTDDLGDAGVPFSGRILFSPSAVPPLNDGVIGAWAMVGGSETTRFATYGPTGVKALFGNAADINTAGPASNVEMTEPATLNGSKTINSLRLSNRSPLNLGGKTLTVDSGGILGWDVYYDPSPRFTISNGTIVPGAGAGGELYLMGTQLITATIADGPGAPTTVVANGVSLAGNNTYSGPTYVPGQLFLEAPGALPKRTDLHLNESQVVVQYAGGLPIELGTIFLKGEYGLSNLHGSTPFDARTYAVESGRIMAPLAGSGTLNKTTAGELKVTSDLSKFAGPINIDGGTVQFDNDLPTGVVRISPAGRLVVNLNSPTFPSLIQMQGGSLVGSLSGGSPTKLGSSVEVTGQAVASLVEFSGLVTVAPAADLTFIDPANTIVTGGLRVDGTARTGGTQPLVVRGDLAGTGSFVGNVELNESGTLAPGTPDDPTGTLSVTGNIALTAGGAFRFDLAPNDNDRLELNGDLTLTGAGDALRLSGGRAGQTYHITNYTGTLNGTFDVVSPFYDVSYDAANRRLTVVPRPVPGDANDDHLVTFGDFQALERHFLQSGSRSEGDANGDGFVNHADFLLLYENFGGSGLEQQAALTSFASAHAIAIPEPIFLPTTLLLVGALRRPRHRRFE